MSKHSIQCRISHFPDNTYNIHEAYIQLVYVHEYTIEYIICIQNVKKIG